MSLTTLGTQLWVERVVVTNVKVIGKSPAELTLTQTYDVVVSRLNRTDVQLVPEHSTTLQFGDILNLVGMPDTIEVVAGMMGNAHHKLPQVHMLPVFIGIGLGALLDSISFYRPANPAALELGLTGGPLVVALIVSHIGSVGTKPSTFRSPLAKSAAMRCWQISGTQTDSHGRGLIHDWHQYKFESC